MSPKVDIGSDHSSNLISPSLGLSAGLAGLGGFTWPELQMIRALQDVDRHTEQGIQAYATFVKVSFANFCFYWDK